MAQTPPEIPGRSVEASPSAVTLDVAVPLRERLYRVHVASGILQSVGQQVRALHPSASRIALISDTQVMGLYGDVVSGALEAAHFKVTRLVVPVGEASKCQTQLFTLIDAMITAGLSRNDVVVAVGGGVIGDLAGLAAATFMRGIGFVQCPTSLLAQVDASVGGKVAIDLPSGKNLFGAFHFPSAVLIDPQVLSTLDDRELGCGLAEMLKHGLLFSKAHVDDLVAHAAAIYRREGDVLTRLVGTSVGYKAACVADDPFEQAGTARGRAWLNLGHTLGHAIENISDFACKHGEAVALGLVAAARLSERRALAKPGLETTIVAALAALRLPYDLDTWLEASRRDAILDYLGRDKKRMNSGIAYVGLRAIGEPEVVVLRPSEILSSIVNES